MLQAKNFWEITWIIFDCVFRAILWVLCQILTVAMFQLAFLLIRSPEYAFILYLFNIKGAPN